MTKYEAHTVEMMKAMKGTGSTNFEIALALGLTEGQVKSACSARGIKKKFDKNQKVPFPKMLRRKYQAEADRRGQRIDNFMRRLLSAVARDNLFSAILDDGK